MPYAPNLKPKAWAHSSDCIAALQVWYQQDIIGLRQDILGETKERESQGKLLWHWHVRGLEHLNDYLSHVMEVGNSLGKHLRKKLQGDPRKVSFGGIMVGSL